MGACCSCSSDPEYRPRTDLEELPPVPNVALACNPDAPLGFRILRRVEEPNSVLRITLELPVDENSVALPLSRDLSYHVLLGIPDPAHPAPFVESTIKPPPNGNNNNGKGGSGKNVDDDDDDGTNKGGNGKGNSKDTKPTEIINTGADAVTRPYTPITAPHEDIKQGEVTFLIRCVDGGAFSTGLARLSVGDRLNVRGPFLKLDVANDVVHHAMKVGLLAAGSGITPIIQLASFFLSPHAHATVPGSRLDLRTWAGSTRSSLRPPAWKVVLIYFARSMEDVLCREMVEGLVAAHPQAFSFHIVPSASPDRARMHDYLAAHLPPPSSDTFIAVCGPERFHADVGAAAGAGWGVGTKGTLLAQLGYQDGMAFSF